MAGRKYALQRLVNLLYWPARKNSYVVERQGKHTTFTAVAQYPRLTQQHVKNHFNDPDKTLHLKSDEFSRWACIDLDCHPADDLDEFIDRADRLLNVCHADGWHYQVNAPVITGCHFIKCFREPQRLSFIHNYLNGILKDCGLANQGIELYPQREHSCRCPGDPHRLLILDDIVEPVVYRKKRAADVERYFDWLEDPARQYMAKDRILSYLTMNLPGPSHPQQKHNSPRHGSFGQKNKHFTSFKGKSWAIVTDFWSGKHCPIGTLDEVLPTTIRIAQSQGYTDPEIIEGLTFLRRQMPDEARECSSRLEKTSNGRTKFARDVKKKIRYMSNGGGQPDPEKSRSILSECKWRGDIFDPSTWEQPESRYNLQSGEFKVSPEQLCDIGTDFVSAFPKKFRHIVSKRVNDIISAMAKLAAIKSKEENGIVYSYWKKFFLDQFHLDLSSRYIKSVLKAAKELGVIKVTSKLGRSNMYQPGRLLPYPYGSILLVVQNEQTTGKTLRELERKAERIVAGKHEYYFDKADVSSVSRVM